MVPIVVRGQQEPRVFTPISPDLYASPEGPAPSLEERAADRVLALSAAPCRGRVRYGWRIAPAARLQRLLHFHREAHQAEQSGKARRADAFWAEVVRELRLLPGASPAWADLAAELRREHAAQKLGKARRLRRRLVDEVLIDGLVAWINGHLQGGQAPPDAGRAADLVAVLERVLRHSELDVDCQRDLMKQATLACVAGLEKAGLWDRAIGLAATLAASDPERIDYPNRLSNLLYQKSVRGIPKVISESEEAYLRQAAALGHAIRAHEAFRARHPLCPDAYDSLASLHSMRAVSLCNGGRISEGLLAVEMSLAYQPEAPEALNVRLQLESLMRSLLAEMRTMIARLGTRSVGYNRQVTTSRSAEGRQLQREADAGFGPRDEYRKGPTVAALARARRIARGRHLWERAGLPRPDCDWDALAARLDEGLALVLARQPKTVADLLYHWAVVRAARPDLQVADFAPETLLSFLGQTEQESAPPGPSAVLTTPPLRKSSPGPFDLWLVRPCDLSFKAAVAAGLLLLLAGGVLSAQAESARMQRDAAFADLKAAAERLDGPAGADAAGRFLNTAFVSRDGRSAAVRKLHLAAPGWPAARARNAAYERLMAAASRRDGAGAVAAADDFLKTALGVDDPRTQQVSEIRGRVREWPALVARDRAYNDVATASRTGDDRALLAAADRFLQAAGSNTDPRATLVRDLKAQAAEAPRRRARDQAYGQLTERIAAVLGDSAEADRDALDAADRFLAAEPTWGAADPRKEQVERLRTAILAAPKRRERDAAYRSLIAAARLGEPGEATVGREAAAFAASLPKGETDPRAEQVARLGDLAQEGPNLRRRDDAYGRLLAAVAGKDEVAAAQAIADFRAATPGKIADPRRGQVDRAERMAAEWPGRRRRDDAFARLRALDSAADDLAVINLAEQFLQARPREGEDPRTTQVRQRYDAAFVRWFAGGPEGSEAQERADRYRTLTAPPTR
ncbi:hypothetical protein EP7_003059 [Isosphaeraceae bacterium EP7]